MKPWFGMLTTFPRGDSSVKYLALYTVFFESFFGLVCLTGHLNSWDILANKASPKLKTVNPHTLSKF